MADEALESVSGLPASKPEMPEPTDAEMADARKALEQWQTPDDFRAKLKDFMPLVKSSVLFNKPNAQFLLDAVTIAELFKYRPLKSVRLANQHDGEAKDENGMFDIEVTEIQRPGRRRGDEYREESPKVTHVPFDPNLGQTVAAELANGVQKKADKKYAAKPLLLVYLNLGDAVGELRTEVEAAINDTKKRHADAFREVCVIWNGKLY
ncbi:hypothetical protein JQ616_12550 [Bradyrhizobium tropiciagri]|uniref:hypothetical protein n=1 Tax=Bradyrhizobium tropiciagri TaxID=312253 RepID=UPI001BA91DB0|nr:hypothetical protein [Bradyrhizobium tropiciagri]MBR0895785.1 hypothetical protein [Bradyrhizobium tropiciagri]